MAIDEPTAGGQPTADGPLPTGEPPTAGRPPTAERPPTADGPLPVDESSPTDEPRERGRKKWPFVLIGVVVGAAVLLFGGTFLYINVLSDDAPEEFSLGRDAPAVGAPVGTIEGTWAVAEGSAAGYRVEEVLFGQNKTAAGRTSDVTGEMTITGTTVEAASFTVDMATVTTDSSARDSQFRGRIMDVAAHPTSTFTLTEPIDLAPVPGDSSSRSYAATGELTLRGTTRVVTMDLETRRVGETIEVVGPLPVVFADYGIPNPSLPGISTEDNGVMEVDLILKKAP